MIFQDPFSSLNPRMRIERLIEEARRGNADPSDVHRELEKWGLFNEYQDRFLALFKGKRR